MTLLLPYITGWPVFVLISRWYIAVQCNTIILALAISMHHKWALIAQFPAKGNGTYFTNIYTHINQFAPVYDCMVVFSVSHLIKDLSMMYRALWDRRHEGATRISQCTRRVLTYIRVAPECLRSHNARYIMLKSDYNMNYLVLIHYEAEIYKRISEAGGGESCIVENLCMVLYVTSIAMPLWRHSDSGVTKSPQDMNANMFKWEIIWIVSFVNCVSIDFNEIYVNLNKNSGSIL